MITVVVLIVTILIGRFLIGVMFAVMVLKKTGDRGLAEIVVAVVDVIFFLGYLSYALFAQEILLAAVFAALAAHRAWEAWELYKKWRGPKDRKPAKVSGLVVNLGHRLGISPA